MTLFVQRVCDHSFIADGLTQDHVVVDLGMNQGAFASWIVANTPARVFGVEPAPGLFEALPRHDRIKSLQLAVGGGPGSLELQLYASHCASFVAGLVPAAAERSVVVEVIDFDGLMRAFALDRINLLKVDIEGAELDMFATLPVAYLKNIDQMTIEFHDFLQPEQRAEVEKIIVRLRKNGFFVMNFGNRVYTDVLALNRATWRLGWLDVAQLYFVKYWRGAKRLLSRIFSRFGR
ncbi:FkbM family methyltransferase [Methylosinus sp. Ce-a6]|uniref:FkbM family methyltransferase n=1 Tax=Methylosinus sp. Ce-a6 TaxID=2172005 RepID=UPI00135CF392|nr:FkbM family methyltransferase [Methylosinus sp. Ce-a6]